MTINITLLIPTAHPSSAHMNDPYLSEFEKIDHDIRLTSTKFITEQGEKYFQFIFVSPNDPPHDTSQELEGVCAKWVGRGLLIIASDIEEQAVSGIGEEEYVMETECIHRRNRV